MANRRPQTSGRRMDFGRNDRGKNFARSGVSPWQGGGPGTGLPNLLPLASGSTEATLALASNLINLLQPRQSAVPSLLDMPIRRDFGPNMGRYDRDYIPNRMGNQGNYRRTGNYNRAGERINTNRKPYKPNDGQRQQNKISPKKEADSKTKPVKESDQDEKQETDGNETNQGEVKDEDSKKEAPKTRYDDINSQLLKCHICNKSMWDGRSFENHLSGRAHAIMMQKTAESYALTADTMRQEFKIREMKRTRRMGQQQARDFYCAMCDMYAADGAVHRTTVGHRKLKKYLHPMCASCHKEMPTRIELDEHRLTAEHLRNMQDKQEITTKPKPEVMVISTFKMEQTYLRDDRQRRRRPDNQEQQADVREGDNTIKEEDNDKQEEEGDENKEKTSEDEKQESSEEKKQEPGIDSENLILDYKEGDDLSHITPEMIPTYSSVRGVGASFLDEFRCIQCKLCHKLLDTEETAQLHLRTWRHQQLFNRMLQEHCTRNKKAQEAQESNKRPSDMDDDNDSGNWKRRKTSAKIDDEDHLDESNGLADEDIVMKEEPNEEKADEDAEFDNTDMPEDDLEDWEQTVDEILEDENVNKEIAAEKPKKGVEKEEAVEKQPAKEEIIVQEQLAKEEVVVEKLPAKEKSPEPAPSAVPPLDEKPRASPRGRGRGRARGRGRY